MKTDLSVHNCDPNNVDLFGLFCLQQQLITTVGSETSECATLTLGELNCMHTVVHNLTLNNNEIL